MWDLLSWVNHHESRCHRRHRPCERSGHHYIEKTSVETIFPPPSQLHNRVLDAGNAVKALVDSLAAKAKLKRNGSME